MTTTGHHGQRLARRHNSAHADRFNLLTVSAPSPDSRTPVVTTAAGGHRHHTKHHAAMLDQRHIDGELFTARNELFGAIERVNQPPARPTGPHVLRDIGVFFRQHRNAGVERFQPINQHMVRGQIGGRHRRVIRLGRHGHIGAPKRQNGIARLVHQLNHALNQFRKGAAHSVNTPRWVSRSRARYSAANARPSLNCGFWTRFDSSRKLTLSTRIGSGSSPSRRDSYRSVASTT